MGQWGGGSPNRSGARAEGDPPKVFDDALKEGFILNVHHSYQLLPLALAQTK